MSRNKIFILLVTFLGIDCITILFFSPIPLRVVAHQLSKSGLVTEGLEGSLSSGIKIRRAIAEGSSARFIIENFSLEYSGIYDLLVNRHLHIRMLHLGELEYVVKNPHGSSDPKSDKNVQSSPANPPSPSGVTSRNENPNEFLKKITVDEVRIGRVTLLLNGPRTPATFILDKFEIDDAHLQGEKTRFKRLKVDSNYLSFEIIPETEGSEGFRVSGTVKAIASPYLRQDFPWKGTLAIRDHQLNDLSVEAFAGQLQAKKINENLQITLNQLSPENFFHDSFPITSVNGNLTWKGIQTPDLHQLVSAGITLRLGNTSFSVPDGVLIHEIPGEHGEPANYGFSASAGGAARTFLLSFWMKQHVNKYAPSTYGFNLTSVPPMREDDLVSEIYFGKNFRNLTSLELETAQKAATFFKLTFPSPAPLPVPLKRSASGKPSYRKMTPRRKVVR